MTTTTHVRAARTEQAIADAQTIVEYLNGSDWALRHVEDTLDFSGIDTAAGALQVLAFLAGIVEAKRDAETEQQQAEDADRVRRARLGFGPCEACKQTIDQGHADSCPLA